MKDHSKVCVVKQAYTIKMKIEFLQRKYFNSKNCRIPLKDSVQFDTTNYLLFKGVPLTNTDYVFKTLFCLKLVYLEDVLTVQLAYLWGVEEIYLY